MRHYNLEASQVAFFSAHLAISEQLTPLERWLSEQDLGLAEHQHLARVIHLSHQYELQFYDAVLQAPLASS